MSLSDHREARVWTIPNGICAARILATPVLVLLALREERLWLVATFFLMTLSDWVDGKLAIALDQRSALGARLDSLADMFMYAALLVGTIILDGERLSAEIWWIALAMGTYLVAGVAGRVKFGRWPSYHTSFAKRSWLFFMLGAVIFLVAPTGILGLGDGPLARWPLRFAFLLVTVGNLQSLRITSILPEWRSDVRTIRKAHAVREEIEGLSP